MERYWKDTWQGHFFFIRTCTRFSPFLIPQIADSGFFMIATGSLPEVDDRPVMIGNHRYNNNCMDGGCYSSLCDLASV